MSSKPIYPRSPKDYSGPKVKDTQTFIQKAQFVHGDAYSYDKSEYVNAHTKLIITCPIHGDFNQRPNNHLKGQGCPSCKFDSDRSNTEKFIQKAQFVHDGKYSYEKAEYINNQIKVIITCPIHGDFEQTPSHHLKGRGCSDCRYDSNRSNTEEFIQKAKSVHGDRYGYDKAVYVNSRSKITINCPVHGDFEQRSDVHLGGYGCPSCKNESNPGGYSDNKEEYKDKEAILYHVRFTIKETDEAFEKFGITTKNSVKERFKITKNHELKLEVINEYPTTLYEAIELEQEIKQHLLDNNLAYRVHTLKQYNLGGWTECFRCGDLDMLFKSV